MLLQRNLMDLLKENDLTSWRIYSDNSATTVSVRFSYGSHDPTHNNNTGYRRIPQSRMRRDTQRQMDYQAQYTPQMHAQLLEPSNDLPSEQNRNLTMDQALTLIANNVDNQDL